MFISLIFHEKPDADIVFNFAKRRLQGSFDGVMTIFIKSHSAAFQKVKQIVPE